MINFNLDNIDLNEVLNEAELLQNDMNSFIEKIQKSERGKKIPYEDLKTIYFFIKIGILQKEINKLKNADN